MLHGKMEVVLRPYLAELERYAGAAMNRERRRLRADTASADLHRGADRTRGQSFAIRLARPSGRTFNIVFQESRHLEPLKVGPSPHARFVHTNAIGLAAREPEPREPARVQVFYTDSVLVSPSSALTPLMS